MLAEEPETDVRQTGFVEFVAVEQHSLQVDAGRRRRQSKIEGAFDVGDDVLDVIGARVTDFEYTDSGDRHQDVR